MTTSNDKNALPPGEDSLAGGDLPSGTGTPAPELSLQERKAQRVADITASMLYLMDEDEELGLARPDDPEWAEKGRVLFAGPCHFVCGAPNLPALPAEGPPEIAFAGRSNVGKSSLINALTGRKTLARTSNTPGRTQELNFFSLGEGRVALVDLPGYGFAQAPKGNVKAWTRTLKAYLAGRSTLRRVMLLIDSRHGPKKEDVEMMNMLDDAAVVYQVVLTKIDKPSKADLAQLYNKVEKILKTRRAIFPRVICTSSAKNLGLAAVRAELALLALQEPE